MNRTSNRDCRPFSSISVVDFQQVNVAGLQTVLRMNNIKIPLKKWTDVYNEKTKQ